MSSALIPSGAGDYKMIESLKIENFRCFESVELRDLKRINVIVGENGSGKTALLEAIFLGAVGAPEIVLRLRGWRGLGDLEIKSDQGSFQSAWRDLFTRLTKTELS
ncbi:MAG: AAA family ATPase [Acidobacteriota bacterium]|nr:AAA family ATPase [Acidobacteriota bacterium]